MVTRSTEAAERSGSREIGPAVRAIGGLLLGLAILVGIGGRHLAQEREAGTAAVKPESVVPVSQAATAVTVPVITVYVVGSQETAELVRDGLAVANAVRQSEPPLRYVVVVVDPVNATAVLEALQDDARILPDGGQSVQIVDLRRAS